MKTAQYPQIGSVVPFIFHRNGVNYEAEGIVLAIALDPFKHLIAHIEVIPGDKVAHAGADTEALKASEKINVNLNALCPSEEYKAAFAEAHSSVIALAKEGNDKSRAVVVEYNKMVEDVLKPVLGEPVVFG